MIRIPRSFHHAGFTLVELMVTLAVAAILAVTAVPSFSSFIRNQGVKATSFELVSALTYARSEAIKRNQTVTIQAEGDDWLEGWVVEAGEAELRTWVPAARLDIDADATKIDFRSDGRAATATSVDFEVCDENGSAGVQRRLIRLDPSGRANLTRAGYCDDES